MANRSRFALASLTAALFVMAGCASNQEKPESTPAPVAEKPAAPAPAPAQAAAPAETKSRDVGGVPVVGSDLPKAPPAPKNVTLKGKSLFDFNKSELRTDAKSALDKDIAAKKGDVKSVSSVAINGHADRLGSQEYNQRLSEKRAEVVKAYLVGKGLPPNSIETTGFGKTQPATGAGIQKCDDSLGRAKLIECLQPHRRVEVELKGEAK